MLHNRYRLPGGEDAVVQAEVAMLRAGGVDVKLLTYDNDIDSDHEFSELLRAGWSSAWSAKSQADVTELCRSFHPDVIHVHNFWFRLTPAVHSTAHSLGIASVQTLHNFRLLCVNSQFLRNGKICEDCLGKAPWRGVLHRCYRNSVVESTAVLRMIMLSRHRKTWRYMVDAFVVMSEHARSKFVEGGFPGERFFVKPNFIEDPGITAALPSSSRTILYAGRLSPEKGLSYLLTAWSQAALGPQDRLLIAGDGPERPVLEQQAALLGLRHPQLTFVGWKNRNEIFALLAAARALVLPSIWYEGGGCPVSLVEALAVGRPAVVSEIGGMTEIILHEHNGLHALPGNSASLANALQRLLRNDALADNLGANARTDYQAKFSPGQNYSGLLRIYHFATERTKGLSRNSQEPGLLNKL
jgi:glycosyltransferase involved in cell wall biosynthesis